MSVIIKRYAIGFATCAKMHDHGVSKLKMEYDLNSPLTFTMSTMLARENGDGTADDVKSVTYEFYRESVHLWLAVAPGGSLLELGQISLKIRKSMPHVVTFKFPAFADPSSGLTYTPMFMMNRSALQKFVADTYVALPSELESGRLNIDDCITKILTS